MLYLSGNIRVESGKAFALVWKSISMRISEGQKLSHSQPLFVRELHKGEVLKILTG